MQKRLAHFYNLLSDWLNWLMQYVTDWFGFDGLPVLSCEDCDFLGMVYLTIVTLFKAELWERDNPYPCSDPRFKCSTSLEVPG